MKVIKIIEKAGGVQELAAKLGVSQTIIYRYRDNDRIPAERALAVARAAGVSPYAVRPDIYPKGLKTEEKQ